VTDFVNFKIKSAQSFECDHRDSVCMRVFIVVNAHTCMSICIYIVFLKKCHGLRTCQPDD
jgi:chorismate mutase